MFPSNPLEFLIFYDDNLPSHNRIADYRLFLYYTDQTETATQLSMITRAPKDSVKDQEVPVKGETLYPDQVKSESSASNIDITGTYRSEITGRVNKYIKNKYPEVKLVQQGNTITGTYGESEGEIWGEVVGNTVKFDFQSSINAGYGNGKWTFKPGSNNVQGTWFNTALGDGDWHLTKVE